MKNKKLATRIIRKYANRRMYDVATSTYMALDDIKQLILAGEPVKVVDIKTEEDVTRNVLLQIIMDEENNREPMLSNEFLFQIIRFYGKSFQPAVSPFLEQGINLFHKMQKNFYTQVKDTYGKEKIQLGTGLWKEFMEQQGPLIQENIRTYVQTNTNNFLQMQEQIQKQTEQMFNYIQFPFIQKGDK